jgi:hypothetical protein
MRHTLRLHGIVVGYSELERIEPEVGRAWGRFRPGLGYELVQPVFRLFAEAVPRLGAKDDTKLDRYHKSRDALGLELFDAVGRAIATTIIHIADYSVEEGALAYELDVLISDERYWTRRGRSM